MATIIVIGGDASFAYSEALSPLEAVPGSFSLFVIEVA